MTAIKLLHILLLFALALFSCTKKEDYQFELLKKDVTNLEFSNEIEQTVDFNVFAYMYFFNGGGVGVGDFNKDGLEDLYFTSNMSPNKLFLNQGDFKFMDVTEKSGVKGIEGWSSGVSIADVNADGFLDIYVCQIGDFGVIYGKNQLFICQGIENGIPIYKDEADKYGLDLVGFSTQASFFDYDLDGDLDMFQLNHSLHANGTFGQRKRFQNKKHEQSGDKLFRNDNGLFTEVTVEAGINSTVIGYGLGIATGDLNNDGWPDIYIGNDFHENDYLYLNNQDGTFKEVLTEQIMHTSKFSMGVDIGDINNDGQNDIISADMLPDDPYILKTSLGEDDFATFEFKIGYGYNYQFARNNLQLNNGDGTFTEIGRFANVFATDWSWSTLYVDFDLDGFKDLFVSNGIPRRMNDIDYLNFRKSDDDVRWKTNTNYVEEKDLEIVNTMPQIKLKNRFFINNGDLTFKDVSELVANNETTYSNGAAFADFDNDGDIDIVVNNIYEEPSIYKNHSIIESGVKAFEERDYIKINLIGKGGNSNALGTRILVFKGADILTQNNFPVRGYQSTVSSKLHIGVGDLKEVDSAIVIWPDRSFLKLKPTYNQEVTLKWEDGLPTFDFDKLKKKKKVIGELKEVSKSIGIEHFHDENPFVEFNRERLIPHMVSSEGPALAVGDINGDGLDDIFIGSAKRRKSKIYIQTTSGRFEEQKIQVLESDFIYEDVDAEIVDIDNDGDNDLIVASGGNEFWGKSEFLNSRLYLNDSKGNFNRSSAFKEFFFTASCVEVGDFNGDGFRDVFFGSRSIPSNYGVKPKSYLFQNLGNGSFKNISDNYPDLSNIGLVKDAEWVDLDLDDDLDLIVAAEWEKVCFFRNDDGELVKNEISKVKGWWNFILPQDFDHDGDVDLVVGNTGRNSKFKPSIDKPLRLYIEDFDDNDQVEQILTYYLDEKEILFANHKELTTQIPFLKKKYLFAKDLAKASLKQIFGEKLKTASILEVNELASIYFDNDGNGNFTPYYLPSELQLSSLEAGSVMDLDNDGIYEILLGGNFYDNNVEMGRYDGDYGHILQVLPGPTFEVSSIGDVIVKNQVRNILPIIIGDKNAFIMAQNEDSLRVVQFVR